MRRTFPALVALYCVLGAAEDTRPRVSWSPFDLTGSLSVPSDPELAGQLADALDFRVREDHDAMLDAWEPGELLSHATLPQTKLDQAPHGNDALFALGDELFEYMFRPEDGLGNGLAGPPPNMRRVHGGAFGGPDAFSCASCHFVGGPDGAGTNTQNAFFRSDGDRTSAADERNPPHVLGLGPIAALAQEMSRDLRALRDQAAVTTLETGATVDVALITHGVSFGTLRAVAGSLDLSGVEGVDDDLTIRPFGWKGHQGTLFGMVEESFRLHLGLVSTNIQERIRLGVLNPENYGAGDWFDIDDDGVSVEVDDAMIATVVAYLAQLEVPILRPPATVRLQTAFARGQSLFQQVGCAGCHVPTLELADPILVSPSPNPALKSDFLLTVDVAREGEAPKPEPKDGQQSAFLVHLFSDLKRHEMGPELATSGQSQIPGSVFLTRPLWGLAETAPYLHDGRAPTVHDAIVAHGGAAEGSKEKYRALTDEERGSIQVYLLSLSRAPQVMVP